ncbi:hypothetical protein C475_14498 [Halosimplex carlsbadense 2-9-1]|uniref:Uncharacterized protein n=1 Tax=Halosimplex carlsbadense 2-9-1 TaxID=797114 RepID=M0CJU1_9EURY|nr:hypothetical protein [Halosimplex carlsbadense]ELZ23491.1 hypothetical protein C475_14498 [Halosimplex carlsbadense 2-9-1]
MTAPYSLRTLAAPELRRDTVERFGMLGMGALAAGTGTAVGSALAVALGVVGILAGIVSLKEIDERARELENA